MTRGGRTKSHDDVERKCIVTGDVGSRSGMVRFVVGPDDQIVPDVLGKLPGRGLWVTATRDALEKAATGPYFSRKARQKVVVPDGLVAEVERQLARRVVDLVAMARKSGDAVTGFEKVRGWLADGKAKVLLQASDGSTRGKSKLWTPEGGKYFGMLSASELGLAFGRESVIHGALAAGGLSKRVIEEASRLAGLRGIDGSLTAGKDKTTA